MVKIQGSIEISENELLAIHKMGFELNVADPVGSEGEIYYNSTEKKIKIQ